MSEAPYDPDSPDNSGDSIAVSVRLVPEPGILVLLGSGRTRLRLPTLRRHNQGLCPLVAAVVALSVGAGLPVS